LTNDSIYITGEYNTVSNGFVTQGNGEVCLPLKELLAVELVKRRSKRLLYAVMVPAAVAAVALGVGETAGYAVVGACAVVVFALGLVYMASLRMFVEVTSMMGTYLVPVEGDVRKAEGVVGDIRKRMAE